MLSSAAFFAVKAMLGTAAGNTAPGAPPGPVEDREAPDAARRRRRYPSVLGRVFGVVHHTAHDPGRTGHGRRGLSSVPRAE